MKKSLVFKPPVLFLILTTCICLSTGKRLQAQHTLTFYAKISSEKIGESGWIGHVWIGLNNGETTETYGFYPGGLRGDADRNADISYPFSITSEKYEKVLVVIDAYRRKSYVLGMNDCRGFASAVATAVGLTVPSAALKSPAEWLADLVDANF